MSRGKPKAKKSLRLKDLVAGMNNGEYVLPEIQREFVWDLDRIADLWDSIFRGYPIGQLLFWQAETKLPTYSFFDKVQDGYLFVNKKPEWTHSVRVNSNNKIIVLDGQQRLTSLFLGLYKDGINCKSRRNVKEPTKKFLCIYVGKEEKEEVFQWREEEGGDYIKVVDAVYGIKKKKGNAARLREKIERAQFAVPVDYVNSESVDEVVKIFQRLNTNGRNMTNAELFIAMWFGADKMGELRKKLEELRQAFGEDFDVKDKTITQLLLFVFGGEGESLNRAEDVSHETFESISEGMPRLIRAAEQTVDFLHDDCGIYSNGEMTSHGLLIPVVDLFYKFGEDMSDKLRAELRCFVYRALVFDLFEKSTNSVLADLRKSIVSMKGQKFLDSLSQSIREKCFKDLLHQKAQYLTDEIIRLVDEKEKGAKTNQLLLLLNRSEVNTKKSGMFDQDHLFARDLFDPSTTARTLRYDKKFGLAIGDGDKMNEQLSEEEAKEWELIAAECRKTGERNWDTLPNLWLLNSRRNQSKGKKILHVWYEEDLSGEEKDKFWRDVLISGRDASSLRLGNYNKLFDERRKVLIDDLKRLLALPK